jgi:hypothetical protein
MKERKKKVRKEKTKKEKKNKNAPWFFLASLKF